MEHREQNPGTSDYIYFQVGFSKCATTSMAHWFRQFGITTHHDPNVWANLYINYKQQQENMLLHVPGCLGHFDFMMCNDNFKLLEDYAGLVRRLQDIPSARFIFNFREKDAWMVSKSKQLDWTKQEGEQSIERYHQLIRSFLIQRQIDLDLEHFSMRPLAFLDEPERSARLSWFYDEFIGVFRNCDNRRNWIFLNIDEDVPEALHRRWGIPIPDKEMDHLNKTRRGAK